MSKDIRDSGERQSETDEHPLPMPSTMKADIGISVGKAVVGLIPVVGGSLAEILGTGVTLKVHQRQEQWINEHVIQRLEELEHKRATFDVRQVVQDDTFVTTLQHATLIAIRSHQQEKLEALRNSVLNAALPGAPSDDEQSMFLDAVDSLTPSHLRLLEYFDDPDGYAERRQITISLNIYNWPVSGLLEHVMPEMQNRSDFYTLAYNNLASLGFVRDDATILKVVGPLSVIKQCRSTDLGRRFLKFIKSPI